MWEKVLGWLLFFGGIFCATSTFYRIFYYPGYLRPHPVEFAILVTLAAALICGGWKLAHGKKGGKE